MPLSSKRVLVTGGAGFVGSHLVDLLVGAGHDVTVLDDLSRGRREWIAEGATLHETDVRDAAAVLAATEAARPEIVVHLAALHFIPAVDDAPGLARAVNVDGTRHVLAAAGAVGARRVLFASTAAVYPNLEGPISERDPVAPIDLYGETKAEGEQMLAELARSSHVSTVSARLFNVIGPRETNPHVLPEIVQQLRTGATTLELGNLDPRRDYVDVRDVAVALMQLMAMESPGSVTFNVGTGRAVSVRELVDVCAGILGRSVSIRQTTERIRSVERMVLLSDARALSDATGWRPSYTLSDTLRELLTG